MVFEICIYTNGGAECTDKMLLSSWKCGWSEIWKFTCFSLMAFTFRPLTLFGDSEYNVEFSISFSAKILTTSSISALFLSLLFLPFPFLPTDFGAPFKANALTDAPNFDRLNHSTN